MVNDNPIFIQGKNMFIFFNYKNNYPELHSISHANTVSSCFDVFGLLLWETFSYVKN